MRVAVAGSPVGFAPQLPVPGPPQPQCLLTWPGGRGRRSTSTRTTVPRTIGTPVPYQRRLFLSLGCSPRHALTFRGSVAVVVRFEFGIRNGVGVRFG